MSKLHATRHPTPCGSKCGCPSCPGIPHSLSPFLALSLCARMPERSHHGRRRQASVPPLLPLLQPSCVCTECRYTSNASRRPSRAHFPVTTPAVSPSPPEQPPAFRLCVRPGQPGPPPADLSSPTHVRRSLDAPHRFVDAVDDHSRRSREPGRSPALPSRGGRRWTTRGNRSFSRGLSEEVVTHVNSAQEDLFADV